jgi:dTDP-4-dehydrorhamnose reductase
MKVLVFGCNGQLGQSLSDSVPEGTELFGLSSSDADVTDASSVRDSIQENNPDVVINAAAYTAVDKAEDEPEVARAVNVEGPRNIATVANEIGARLIHISTDFVFDGNSSVPYTTEAQTNPLNTYGRTKRDGELAVLHELPTSAVVIRTSWLYSRYGNNFVKTMLRLMEERDELGIVADKIGTPTWASSLAEVIWGFAGAPQHRGVFHWSDHGETNWHEFAVAIQEEALSCGLLNKAIPVHAITSDEYPAAALRPRYSVLDCSATQMALGIRPTDWRSNLNEMLKKMAYN